MCGRLADFLRSLVAQQGAGCVVQLGMGCSAISETTITGGWRKAQHVAMKPPQPRLSSSGGARISGRRAGCRLVGSIQGRLSQACRSSAPVGIVR